MEEKKKTNTKTSAPKKNFKRRPRQDNIKIMALGGLGEVGKNCYVIEYRSDLFVIDFGVLFPDKDQLGVDYIIGNYTYLKENESRIKGLFITHGHEDHIGGIPFLLKKIKIPAIYAPITAKLMIEKKLKEHKLTQKIVEINDNTKLSFGKVTMETFRQTHSIPDSLGMFFETPAGNIVTTGDFKVDFSPPGQESADFKKMVYLANKGVLCLLSDSTNSMTPGFSLSESTVGKNLKTLISEAEGRIMFTTFASNINRVQQIIQGALENNRKVCILGRSLVNALQIGTKTSYINIKSRDLIEPKQIKNYDPSEVVIISTGSQGESLAALSRIAHGLNPHITLDDTDTVVFASNPIPGNNYQIGKVIDALSRTECKVIKNSDYFKTHASGHASQEEQKLLLTLWKPTYFAPVHGTHTMQQAHKKTAMLLGIKEDNIFILDNGDVLNMNKKKPTIKCQVVPGSSIYISGNNINVSLTDGTMDKIASDGILVFTAIYDKNRNLVSYPQIITRGFVVINESLDLLRSIQSTFLEHYHQNKRLNMNEIQELLNSKMTQFIYEKTDKVPLVSTHLIAFNPDNSNKKEDNVKRVTHKKVVKNNKPKFVNSKSKSKKPTNKRQNTKVKSHTNNINNKSRNNTVKK